jgi:hypothetical protein
MKPINAIFFGEKGITSTSANHVCNVGKEYIESIHRNLDSLNFITTSVSEFNGERTHVLKEGMRISEEDIVDKLDKITKIHSLIAYLREAIKAKEAELKEVEDKKFECSVDFPAEAQKFTMEDAMAELSIKERYEYYALEAEAAVIGKFIHPKSPYDMARTALMDCASDHAEIKETGGALMIIKKVPVHTQEEVDELFFKLQRKHREISARLNALNHRLEERMHEVYMQRNAERSKALVDYMEIRKREGLEFENFKKQESKRIGQLKIVIPHDMEATFNFVNTL